MANINHQMTEVYGMDKDHCCRECAHFDADKDYCAVAKAGGLYGFWVACGKFEEDEK